MGEEKKAYRCTAEDGRPCSAPLGLCKFILFKLFYMFSRLVRSTTASVPCCLTLFLPPSADLILLSLPLSLNWPSIITKTCK